MDLKRNKDFVAPAVAYQGTSTVPLSWVHFCTILSVPLKEHFCTPSDKNVPLCPGTKNVPTKLGPSEVQLEQHAILYEAET